MTVFVYMFRVVKIYFRVFIRIEGEKYHLPLLREEKEKVTI